MIRRYYGFHTHQWSIHILPSINFYIESNSPYLHDEFVRDGISGIFLTMIFLRWSVTFGLYKEIDD
jgi:hypothetical protein